MLYPGVVAALCGGRPAKLRPYGSLVQTSSPHFFERERRIGDDAIEGGETVAREERGLAQRVAAHDLEILDAVQEQVHARDGGRGEVLLLPEQLAPQACGRRRRLSRTW